MENSSHTIEDNSVWRRSTLVNPRVGSSRERMPHKPNGMQHLIQRRLPLVNRATGLMLGEVEKAELTTDSQLPVRTLNVPGTGTDDVANNHLLPNWWILSEVAFLERRSPAPQGGRGDTVSCPAGLAHESPQGYIAGTDIGA
jgi:hypothetical protein